jgi:predicted ATPase
MSEKLRQINFSGFRGLPDYACDLKGRNLLVCAGNGKGKSAIVDGLEFFFSGSVHRFHGEGTGNINHDSAVRHIRAKGPPFVGVSLVPANENLGRKLGAGISPSPKKDSVSAYIAACSEPSSFILRRAQILGFIESQDSDRYQRLVGLLGLRSIHTMQERFVQASQESQRRADTARTRFGALLQSYEDRESGFSTTSIQLIRDRCKQLLEAVGIDVEASPEGLVCGDAELEKRRSPQTRKRLDAIALAVGSLSVQLDEGIQELAEKLRTVEVQLLDLVKESPEAEQLRVMNAGYDYFLAHEALEKCPLCEQPLLEGYAHVFARLKSRREALGRVSEARRSRGDQLDRLITSADRAASRLGEDLRHSAELDSGVAEFLEQSRGALAGWAETLRTKRSAPQVGPVELPECLSSLQSRRTIETDRLKAVQSELTSQQSEAIERASSLLKRYIQNEDALLKAESASVDTSKLAKRAEATEQAFTKSREDALGAVLSRMADTVLDYYIRLHDVDGAECTKVEFLTTGRARAGGLRFVIDFLNSASGSDPRAFLSDGHLDSLGLCLYLATAKLFNTPGMPLVLDDVLTSADREHRHRVADLLLEEFGEFQLIVTTHDERWFAIFQDKAAARGEQQEWRFQRIANWSVETGPESAAYEGTWAYIGGHLDENSYRELGGSLRLVLEDFMKRVAEKIELEVRYRRAANYTAGDFHTAGLVTELRRRLLDTAPQDESVIKKELSRAFGDEDLINFLSHDNPGRLEVTLQQTKDFVEGLQELTKFCEVHKLIKGITV